MENVESWLVELNELLVVVALLTPLELGKVELEEAELEEAELEEAELESLDEVPVVWNEEELTSVLLETVDE